VAQLPEHVPIDCVLLPMEGDLQAGAPLLGTWARVNRRHAAHAGEGLAPDAPAPRSGGVQPVVPSTCICCGFGAIILLLVLSEIGQPAALEQSRKHLGGEVRLLEEQLKHNPRKY